MRKISHPSFVPETELKWRKVITGMLRRKWTTATRNQQLWNGSKAVMGERNADRDNAASRKREMAAGNVPEIQLEEKEARSQNRFQRLLHIRLGVYEACLNGEKGDVVYLAPFYNDYRF